MSLLLYFLGQTLCVNDTLGFTLQKLCPLKYPQFLTKSKQPSLLRIYQTFTHPQWNFLPDEISADHEILADARWKSSRITEEREGGKKQHHKSFFHALLLLFLFHQRQHSPIARHQTLAHVKALCVNYPCVQSAYHFPQGVQ